MGYLSVLTFLTHDVINSSLFSRKIVHSNKWFLCFNIHPILVGISNWVPVPYILNVPYTVMSTFNRRSEENCYFYEKTYSQLWTFRKKKKRRFKLKKLLLLNTKFHCFPLGVWERLRLKSLPYVLLCLSIPYIL